MTNNGLYEFGVFRLDVRTNTLFAHGKPVKVAPKVFDCLALLVEQNGNLVSKAELFEKVWSDTFVEDSSLSYTISQLRKTLSEYDSKSNYIETVPRRGFRFLIEVKRTDEVVLYPQQKSIVFDREKIEEVWIEESEDSDSEYSEALARKGRNFLPGKTLSRTKPGIALIIFCSITLTVAGFWYFQTIQKTGEKIESLAVLPVRSFSKDAGDDELRLKITDALITNIGKFQAITVRPTGSVLQFADSPMSSVEIGKLLKVDAVLEGRLQNENGVLRTTFQLVSVKSDQTIWSGQFDGKVDKILLLQDQVARKFASEILARNSSGQIPSVATTNNEAYEYYLKGRYFFNQRGVEFEPSLKKAQNYFEKSLESDPNFVSAIAELANTVNMLTTSDAYQRDEGYAKARQLALQAISLDPDSVEAHTALGWIFYKYDWNYFEAEKSFNRAIEINPNYSLAYTWLAIVTSLQGKHQEALDSIRIAEALDPTAPSIINILLDIYVRQQNCEKVFETLARLSEFQTFDKYGLLVKAETLIFCQKFDEAIPILENIIAISENGKPPPGRVFAALGYAYAVTNQTRKALDLIRILESKENNPRALYAIIITKANLGETEGALKTLDEFFETRDDRLVYLKTDPRLKIIRSTDRFQEILKKLNLSPDR